MTKQPKQPQPQEIPTPAEMLANVISKTGKSEGDQSRFTQSISVRLDVIELSTISALATYSGKSRNWMIEELLKVGLAAVWPELNELDSIAIQELRAPILRDAMDALKGGE